MPVTDSYDRVDPKRITIDRENRQRREINVDDLKADIQERGVLHPILVDRALKLIAGERRLTACLELGITVPIRYFDTLSPREAEIVQLVENIKRKDLPWVDDVRSHGRIHELHAEENDDWTEEKTAKIIGISPQLLSYRMRVYEAIDPKSPDYQPELLQCKNLAEASSKLRRKEARQTDRLMSELLSAPRENAPAVAALTEAPAAANAESGKVVKPTPKPIPLPTWERDVVNASFLEWAPQYSGPKFNLIHCDFPYGINVFAGRQMSRNSEVYDDKPDTYWDLLKCLCENLDRLMFHHGHIVFWFSMNYYTETIRYFHQHASDLFVNPKPLVWLKSDNAGVSPDAQRRPRQIYETALLCSRNDARLVKVFSNAYSCPTARQLHPSAKPEPMLRYFFEGLVDQTTRLLDPTCGSGTALCAAESLKAEAVFGMDIDAEHVETARAALRKVRVLGKVA